MQLIARRFDNGQLVRITIESRWIKQINPVECTKVNMQENGFGQEKQTGHRHPPTADAVSTRKLAAADSWPWVAPGLVDLQVNGYGGQEFSSPDLTVEKVLGIALAMDRFGLVRFCPTITTNSREVTEHALQTIAQACQVPEAAQRIAGIHLEGPYISAQDGARGAHPAAHCRPPNWQEFQQFQKAAKGRIRILTLSPEYPESQEFIRQASATGLVVAIGHTAATPEQIHQAAEAGARMSTHLGNGCHPVLPRHRNYLWAQLADDRLTAGLIADGFHLPPDVLKCLIRAKGPQRCVLVSDLSGMAGLPPGRYRTNLCELEILPSGKMVIAGQQELLAGATLPVGEGVVNAMRYAGLDLSEAIRLATEAPCRILGIEPHRLVPGSPADLVLFDLELEEKQNTQDVQNGQMKNSPSRPQENTKTTPPLLQFHVRATILGGQRVFGNFS
ncbi:MAG: amidohydrolase family protein [Thermoguttaceae bacterium]|nr:amidohydrolase family protein [Thermoguttaceae bacterium]